MVAQLKILSGGAEANEEDEADPNEVNNLYEEATMPIEDVMSKYGNGEEAAAAEDGEEGSKLKPPVNPRLAKLGEGSSGSKPISPFLRAKRNPVTGASEESEEEAKKNSHIHFDKDGEPMKKEEEEVKDEPKKEEAKSEKDDADDKKEVKDESETVNGHSNGEEKTNGDKEAVTEGGDVDKAVPVSKGKGKGKGKGKSNLVKPKNASEEEEAVEEEPLIKLSKPKAKKTAEELYQSVLNNGNTEEEEDEEDSDEEDEEFGEGEDSTDDDDDDDEEAEEGDELDETDTEEEEDQDDDDDDEEVIGGDFNDEVNTTVQCENIVGIAKFQQINFSLATIPDPLLSLPSSAAPSSSWPTPATRGASSVATAKPWKCLSTTSPRTSQRWRG